MGKRQLGELQPSELVVTILVSNIATLPLEDTYYNLYYNFYIDSSEVDIETPGVYKIRYRLVSDEAGIRQELGNAVLILVVEEE